MFLVSLPCNALSQSFKDDRYVPALALTCQEMKMLGHEDMRDDAEAILPAHVLQNFTEKLF